MFIFEDKCEETILENGVKRTIKGHLKDLMIVHLKWQKGMVGTVHTHPHTQCVYVLKGSFEASIKDDIAILKAGDCLYAEGDVSHGLRALEDNSEIIDIFTPCREDFLAE